MVVPEYAETILKVVKLRLNRLILKILIIKGTGEVIKSRFYG